MYHQYDLQTLHVCHVVEHLVPRIFFSVLRYLLYAIQLILREPMHACQCLDWLDTSGYIHIFRQTWISFGMSCRSILLPLWFPVTDDRRQLWHQILAAWKWYEVDLLRWPTQGTSCLYCGRYHDLQASHVPYLQRWGYDLQTWIGSDHRQVVVELLHPFQSRDSKYRRDLLQGFGKPLSWYLQILHGVLLRYQGINQILQDYGRREF